MSFKTVRMPIQRKSVIHLYYPIRALLNPSSDHLNNAEIIVFWPTYKIHVEAATKT